MFRKLCGFVEVASVEALFTRGVEGVLSLSSESTHPCDNLPRVREASAMIESTERDAQKRGEKCP